MCEPTSMMILGGAALAMQAGGGIVSMLGQRKQADAQAKMYEYQSAVNNRNAEIADMQSEQVQAQAEQDKLDASRRWDQLRGEGRTNYAAGNVMLGAGSPVDWENQTNIEEQFDKNKIQYNADLEKWAYENQKNSFVVGAQMADNAADNVQSSKNMNTFGSLLGTAGTVSTGAFSMFGGQSYTQDWFKTKSATPSSFSSNGGWGLGNSGGGWGVR